MKKTLVIVLAVSVFKQSPAQITKNNWLVGGSGIFSSTTYGSGVAAQRVTKLQLSPNTGYFFADKFAAGLRASFGITRNKILTTPNYQLGKSISYGGGPFLRYYFLPVDKPFNILADGNYQFSIQKNGGVSSNSSQPVDFPWTTYKINSFSFAAGPVLYFNSSVGLECLIGYSTVKRLHIEGSDNTFQAVIGLQVHLDNDKQARADKE